MAWYLMGRSGEPQVTLLELSVRREKKKAGKGGRLRRVKKEKKSNA